MRLKNTANTPFHQVLLTTIVSEETLAMVAAGKDNLMKKLHASLGQASH
jgi:hypothetical protein